MFSLSTQAVAAFVGVHAASTVDVAPRGLVEGERRAGAYRAEVSAGG
jgi:L-cystine uptake protein TcyP (sodium:dicarboxylate symporter family)